MLTAGNSHWLLPILGLTVLGIAIVWWSARANGGRVKPLAVSLKLFALLLLGLCLIEPVWSGVHPRPRSNLFALLIDSSRSMTTGGSSAASVDADQMAAVPGSSTTAAPRQQPPDSLAAQIQETLRIAPGHWREMLAQDFELHSLVFDRRLREVPDPETATFDGNWSSLNLALNGLQQRFVNRPLGGVLLFSDGNATDLETLRDVKNLPPVYPVLFRDRTTLPDVAIESVSVTETPFEDAPVSIQCDISIRGLQSQGRDLMTICRLVNLDGQTLKTERLTLTQGTERQTFRMQHRPGQTGLEFARLETRILALSSREDEPLEEVTLANNQRLIQFHSGHSRQRILYLSGRPNWEFKFLRRAVEEDTQVDLVGLIRVAKREAKFDFRGRDGQSSNSLFRGFRAESDEETERYDEPVLVRLNTKDAEELRGGFPKAAAELFAFDAIILDDVEAEFFTRDQLTLLKRFVSERGGGLLMLGGQESFQSGGYERTPVADVLPVYLDKAAFPAEDSALTFDLTREGWLQPFIRLRSTEPEEQERLNEMTSFKTMNPVDGIKPGASVLATVRDSESRQWPAFAAQPFGRGRAGALMLGDFWRWNLNQTEQHSDDCARAWRQMIRWLVADVPSRLELRTTVAPEVSAEAVRLSAHAVDREFRSVENARVRFHLKPEKEEAAAPSTTATADAVPDRAASVEGSANPSAVAETAASEKAADENSEMILEAEPSLTEPGLWSVVFVPKTSGAWRISAEATISDGEKIQAEPVGWISQPEVLEFARIGTNRAALQTLADETGGELIEAESLASFVSGLQRREMPVMEPWSMPLWDQPLILLIVFGLLGGEWWLRRSRGLP